FVDDLKPEGLVHVAMLRSPLAHATIRAVNVSDARKAPGVVAAFTAADLENSCAPMRIHLTTPGVVVPVWPVIARERVRYVGEVVAVVVADSRYSAEDALELVSLDLDPLPVVSTFEEAMSEDSPPIHDAVPKNRY